MVAIWIVTLSLTDRKNDLPKYAKIAAYLSGLNILCMITATLLWGHGTVYGINILDDVYPVADICHGYHRLDATIASKYCIRSD